MSNLFDTAINKFLIESYNSDVYQPQERVEDHIKYRSTLAHLGYNHEDEEFVDKNFKQHKGRTMAEAIKDLEEKEDSGEGAAQQSTSTSHQGNYSSEDPLRGQIKIRPEEVYNQGSN